MDAMQQEINQLIYNLRTLRGQVANDIKADLKGPAELLVAAIKGRTPESVAKHVRYKKHGNKKRMPKGSGIVAAVYKPKNLRKSIGILGKLRRTRLALIVGARMGTKRNDGYYIHFVNNDVRQSNGKIRIGQKFVEAGIAAAGPVALRALIGILSSKFQTTNEVGKKFGADNWAKAYARAKGRE
jgi:ribosomal protein L14